jgi:tripeptidyl-peptidase-1
MEQIHDLFAPSQESVDAVRQWLEASGINGERISQSYNKQWIQFDAEAEEAERLLHTKYYVYEHEGSGHQNIACDE